MAPPKDIGKPFQVRFPAGKGLYVRVCERPALLLDDHKLESLLNDLSMVARSALAEQKLSYGIFEKTSEALRQSLITILYDKKLGPIAFNVLPILDVEVSGKKVEVMHLGLVMIDPRIRSKGISSLLYGFSCTLYALRNQFRSKWISSVTQVPAIVGLVSELYSDTYPSTPSVRRSFTHLQIARQIMKNHRSAFGVGEEAEFDEEAFIIRNAYTGGSGALKKSLQLAPQHRKEQYNLMCSEKLNYERGDDFLQIGKLDISAIHHYLFRMIPDGHFVAILGAFSFLIMQHLFFPIIYWFDISKEWGDLRPWKK